MMHGQNHIKFVRTCIAIDYVWPISLFRMWSFFNSLSISSYCTICFLFSLFRRTWNFLLSVVQKLFVLFAV